MKHMRLLSLVVGLLVAIPAFAVAYDITITEPETPYEIVELGEYDGAPNLYLGTLDQYPIMYQFRVEGEARFVARLRQQYVPPAPVAFSLILIRQNENGRGVTEVARLNPEAIAWTREKDPALGLTFWQVPELAETLATGTYRLEVSSPENEARYVLELGAEAPEAGYFTTLGNIRTTQAFFGYSVVKLLTSRYVYLPLGILLLIIALQQTWRYRHRIAHVE